MAVLIASWSLRVAEPSLKTFGNVSLIVVGVIIASYGEIQFDVTGVIYQITGLIFEATRLILVQILLNAPEYKMDPLVSLYYYAPVCAVINGVVSLIFEGSSFTMDHVYKVGIFTLVSNAMIAFLLNVSVVFLVCTTIFASLYSTDHPSDWQDLFACAHSVRCFERHSASLCLDDDLGDAS